MIAYIIRLEGEQFPEKEESSSSKVYEQYQVISALDELIPYDDASYGMWRFIDPYGMTVFNRYQMDQFIAELDRLSLGASTGQLFDLDRIRRLALKCKSEPHLYLKFYGD